MTLPANMFFDNPEVQDVSKEHLSTNVEEWPEDIVQKIKERIPSSAGLSMIVKMKRKDDENGTAVGAVTVSSANKVAMIPVVIKDFLLYPLDIMIAEKKILPLTPDYFDAIFSDNDVFSKIEEFPSYGGLGRFEEANLWNAVYPPSLGRYSYASSGEFPILEEIASTITADDIKTFKDTIKGDMKIAAMFQRHDRGELVTKLANLRPVNDNEFRQGIDNLIPKSVAVLRYESPNKYSVLSSSDTVFTPAITKMDRCECEAFLSQICDDVDSALNEVDQNGEKVLTQTDETTGHILAVADQDKPVMATEAGHYAVKSKSGSTELGFVVPTVIDFDNKVLPGLKIFLGKTFSTMQHDICGVPIKKSDFYPLKGCTPKIGQTGVFTYAPDKSHALATVPVTIKAISQIDGCNILTVVDLNGITCKIKTNHQADGLERIAKMPGPDGTSMVCLPKSMKWAAMEGFYPISDSLESYAVKLAAQGDAHPVKLIATGYDHYALRGVDKYASAAELDKTNLLKSEAMFILSALGMSKAAMDQAFKATSMRGYTDIHGLNFIPLKQEKIAKAKPLANHLRKIAASFKRNLIKEASYMENAQTVDSLLSLNFVNPDNIAKFVGKIPQFKSAISQLASCLLASRLGMQEIPEQAAATAMERLSEVVHGLEKLRAGQEMGVK